jgi:hypothetical protein
MFIAAPSNVGSSVGVSPINIMGAPSMVKFLALGFFGRKNLASLGIVTA